MKKLLMALSVILILIGGWKLRLLNYADVPVPGESKDEYSYSWMGLSLIELGVPVGITSLNNFSGCEYHYINVDGIVYTEADDGALPICKPWFDHPPLLGLLTGGYAYTKGARVFEDATTGLIRKPLVVISLINLGLVVGLGLLLNGVAMGLVAGVVMAVSPLVIVSGRMIQAENVMMVFFLAMLIFLRKYEKEARAVWWWMASVSAGLAVLSKISGVAAVLTGAILLATRRKSAMEVAMFGMVAGSIGGLFAVYGAAIDWRSFVTIWMSNAGREFGLGYNVLNDLFTSAVATGNKGIVEGLVVGGVMSLAILMRGRERWMAYIVVPFLVYLATYLLFGSLPYGWYRIPYYPLLALAVGGVFSIGWKKRGEMIVAILIFLIMSGVYLEKLVKLLGIERVTGFRIVVPFVIALLVGVWSIQDRRMLWIGRGLMIAGVTATALLAVRFDLLLSADKWMRVF